MDTSLVLEKNKLSGTVPWLILLEVSIPSTPATTIYLVRNTEDITFNSQTYTAFPFELDVSKQVSKGDIPTIELRVNNVTRTLQSYLEDYDGLVDESVTIRVVAKPTGESVYHEAASWTYDILAVHSDAQYVYFTLGAPNPLSRRFPLYRYIAFNCRWRFRLDSSVVAPECGYAGNDSATTWTQSTAYTVGDIVKPTSVNGHYYRCTTAGTSDATEPTWTTIIGNTVTDGSVTWTENYCKKTLQNCQDLDNSERFGGFPGLGSGGIRLA
jgi:phage-related protein